MASKVPFKDIMVGSFAGCLGFLAAFAVYIFIALLLFVPGFILLKKEQAKPKEQQSMAMKVLAYVLMALGMVIGLGMGSGIFFNELGGEF